MLTRYSCDHHWQSFRELQTAMTMALEAAKVKARELKHVLNNGPLPGEEISVGNGNELRPSTPIPLRGSFPNVSRAHSPENGRALPSRDPRLAHYQNELGERPLGGNTTSHLALNDVGSKGNRQLQTPAPPRAIITQNYNTVAKDTVTNAPGKRRNSTQTERSPMDRGSAYTSSQSVPVKKSKVGSSSNTIPLGMPKIPPKTQPKTPQKTPDNEIEILPALSVVSKKNAISKGPPLTATDYEHAFATIKSGLIDWRDTYITHVDFIWESDEFPPPKSKKKHGSSDTASENASQPTKKQRTEDSFETKEISPHTVVMTSKNPALTALPPQVQALPAAERRLSAIAGTSPYIDDHAEVDLDSPSMQNAIQNTGNMIARILEGNYIYMPLARFEIAYKEMQVTRAPSLSLHQLRANYGHRSMLNFIKMVEYPANVIAKFIRAAYQQRPSFSYPGVDRMHRLEVFDLDASTCVFPGTTVNVSCLLYLLKSLPGISTSENDYMDCSVDKLFDYLINHSSHQWTISRFDQGNRLLLQFNGRGN